MVSHLLYVICNYPSRTALSFIKWENYTLSTRKTFANDRHPAGNRIDGVIHVKG
jgi:hypothetical protein